MSTTKSPLFGHYTAETGDLIGLGGAGSDVTPFAKLTQEQASDVIANPSKQVLIGTKTDNEVLVEFSSKYGVYRISTSDIVQAGGDIGKAINTALGVSSRVFVPAQLGPFTQSTRIDIVGKEVSSDGATVTTPLSYVVSMDGVEPTLKGFKFIGNHAASSYMVRIASTSSYADVDVEISNGNSGVQCDGPDANLVVVAKEMRGSGVRLNGSNCLRTSLVFDGRNLASFGVYVTGGARARTIRASKVADSLYFTAWQLANRPETALGQCGLETIGVTSDSPGQYIEKYYAYGSGDAGCSLSSNGNILISGRAEDCALNGLSLIGSDNQVALMYASGCMNGVGFTPNAGGLSKRNSVGTLIAIANDEYGADNGADIYVDWVANGATTSIWCNYGLNVYKASATPAVFGTTPPTHTSGSVSDGVNTWTFWASDATTLDANDNYIGFLDARNNVLGDVHNAGAGFCRVGGAVTDITGLPPGGGYIPGTQPASGANRGINSVDNQHTRGSSLDVASGQESTISGGSNNRATGQRGTVGGGFGNQSANIASTISGGDSNTAGASYSWIPGGRQADVKVRPVGAWANGRFGTRNGSAQALEVVQRCSTTDATTTRLLTDGATVTSGTTVAVQDSGCQAMQLLVEAYQTGGTAGTVSDSAAWIVPLLASRAAVGGLRIAGGGTSIAPSLSLGSGSLWRLSITADTTLGSINISGIGEANKTIEWVARWVAVEKAA